MKFWSHNLCQQLRSSWKGLFLTALLGSQSALAIDLKLDDPDSIKEAARTVATGMTSFYTGMRPGDIPGNLPSPYYWWEAGAMFGALIDYWAFTGDDQFNDITTQAMLWQASPSADYMPANQTRTEGNDDQAFWGMAVMSAAERKFPNPPQDKPQWLALAQAVFNTQAPRWDTTTCGGGLRWQIFQWNNGYTYKNTVSNGCLFNLASRLARYTENSSYADWAEKAWDWTESVGFMTPELEFYDGADDTGNCTKVNKLQWTYNNGLYMLGAANMYNITNGDPKWEDRLTQIISAADRFFSPEVKDVMYERECEPLNNCGPDQKSFKAYLSRWMGATTQVAPFTYDLIMPKLQASALAAAKSCTGGDNGTTCGVKWTTGQWDGSTGVGEQMSALEVIQANLIAKVEGPVTNSTGGISKGDPAAGGNPLPPIPDADNIIITIGDRAGAGILTGLFVMGMLGGSYWMVAE